MRELVLPVAIEIRVMVFIVPVSIAGSHAKDRSRRETTLAEVFDLAVAVDALRRLVTENLVVSDVRAASPPHATQTFRLLSPLSMETSLPS